MKKFVSILFFFLYLTSFSGVAVNTSYCCGKIISVKVSLTDVLAHEMPNQWGNCCNQTAHFYKVHEAQQASNFKVSLKEPVLVLPVLFPVNALAVYTDPAVPAERSFPYNSPPDLNGIIPLFTLYDSYLI